MPLSLWGNKQLTFKIKKMATSSNKINRISVSQTANEALSKIEGNMPRTQYMDVACVNTHTSVVLVFEGFNLVVARYRNCHTGREFMSGVNAGEAIALQIEQDDPSVRKKMELQPTLVTRLPSVWYGTKKILVTSEVAKALDCVTHEIGLEHLNIAKN